MYYPQEIIEELRLMTDIVDVISEYTSLKQAGINHMGLCPFHKEKSASFSVSSSKQLFHCFGCGVSGNVISFIMKIENYDFVDTIKYLAQRNNYILPDSTLSEEMKKKEQEKATLREMQIVAAKFFYHNLTVEQGDSARYYLRKRQISVRTIKKFGLGFASKNKDALFKHLGQKGYSTDLMLKSGLIVKKDMFRDRFINRLMFPIFDISGKVIAFGGRTIDQGKPKYLNSSETSIFNKSDNLYALNYARTTSRQEIIIVEGYMDVLALYQAGITNVVATLGTAFTEKHARKLKKYTSQAILLFDSDEAGTKAALKAIPILENNGLKTKVLQVTQAKDPDDYIKQFGVESFKLLLGQAKTDTHFQIDNIKQKYNLSRTEDKIDFTVEVADLLSNIDNAIEQNVYTKEVADLTGISEDVIGTEISKVKDNILLSKNAEKRKNISSELMKDISKNIDEARKGILNILATDKYIRQKLSGKILPEEFVEAVYIKLYRLIYKSGQENLYAADLVSYFDTEETQSAVSNIFVNSIEYEDMKAMEKAINQQIRLIKNAYIDKKIQEVEHKAEIEPERDENVREFQELLKLKNNVKDSYITLLDG